MTTAHDAYLARQTEASEQYQNAQAAGSNPNAIKEQNSVTAHMAYLARNAEASEQYWKNQAEGNKRMQYARPQDEMRVEERIRIELDERRRQQEEINILKK